MGSVVNMKKITAKNTLQIFWKHTLEYKRIVFVLVLFTILRSIFHVITPFFSKQLFDVLAEGTVSTEAVQTLVGILVAIVAVDLLAWSSAQIRSFALVQFQTTVSARLRETAFSYMMRHSYRFFTNSFSGSLVRKVNRFARSFEMTVDETVFNLIPLAVTIIISLFAISSRHILLGVIMFAWTILFIGFNYFVSLWKQPYELERASIDSQVTGTLADSISNSTTTKLFSGITHEDSLYHLVLNRWRTVASFTWNLNEIVDRVQALLMIGINFVVMYFAVIFWQRGLFTIGDFVLIQGFLLALFHQLWNIGRVLRTLYQAFADAQEMVEILETPHEVDDHPRATELVASKGEIIFKNVTFAFQKTRTVLKGFDLHIQSGEKIALVGPSGAGKSTITQLLLRFHDIDKGVVSIDGQDIARVTQDSLRDAIAFVPQEPILFHRTLMENIRYGRRDAKDQDVIDAAEKAHCHEFISRLSEGYNTYVGERGVKLSGGERQRVAIARAILKDAPILVLDEATSSLDSESESFIQESLKDLMKGRTTIVIAHRLSTIMQMDRIVVIDEGRVVDSGTHNELLSGEGIYKKLWDIQAGGFLE